MDFFVRALGYRRRMEEEEADLDLTSINLVEEEIIGALFAFALKLALDDFKPIFYRCGVVLI